MTSPILLCIATGQNLANLIPATHIEPAEIWILETARMRSEGKGQSLARMLKQRNLPCRIEAFADTDIAMLEAEAERIAMQLCDALKSDQPLIFNATGGTKEMALILGEAFARDFPERFEILYADTTHQRIDWLRPRGRGSEAMKDLLKLEDILGAQGFRLGKVRSRQETWMKAAENRGMFTKELGDHADRYSGLFGALNSLAEKACRNEKFESRQTLLYEPAPQFHALLQKAKNHDLLSWDGETGIEFANPAAAEYIGGGWLEEYAFFKLRGCTPRDFVISAEVIAPDGQTVNEIDALVVHRNRLLAVECKTVRFGRDRNKDADIMYKLDSLAQRAGGLMHDRLLLSARTLDEHSQARAKELDITVVAAKEVRNLSQHIKTWMET